MRTRKKREDGSDVQRLGSLNSELGTMPYEFPSQPDKKDGDKEAKQSQQEQKDGYDQKDMNDFKDHDY
ncbi:unnamed protein product [Strongylus vulgaris]|uniref:Uncharacterized protein n=1 Tax=Strongylus vulgaris TaxID=40348 RepID=A0A3P7J659_STRVU|nr:unnamed protein product [Strongylus vulgaris]